VTEAINALSKFKSGTKEERETHTQIRSIASTIGSDQVNTGRINPKQKTQETQKKKKHKHNKTTSKQ
jgi:uncharacterized UBP type Zn finger protein